MEREGEREKEREREGDGERGRERNSCTTTTPSSALSDLDTDAVVQCSFSYTVNATQDTCHPVMDIFYVTYRYGQERPF